MIENAEALQMQREQLRGILVKLPEIMQGEPKSWFFSAAKEVSRLLRNRHGLPPEMQEFLVPRLEEARLRLRQEASFARELAGLNLTFTDDFIAERAEMVIMDVSHKSATPFTPELEPIPQHTIPIEQLLKDHPDSLRVSTLTKGNIQFTMLGMRQPDTDIWHDVPLPLDNTMWYKGGIARAVLKIHANAAKETIASELPPNDLDVAFVGDLNKARMHATLMGVDPEGVEQIDRDHFDFTQYCHGRDISVNQVCLGIDGLHYSPTAFQAAQTGYIELVSRYIPIRALYGVDQFTYQGMLLVKPRGAMRYIKSTAEKKAEGFDYPEINRHSGIGLYPIILAKRWANRDNFGELMQRMFYLCQQMQLVQEGSDDIFDFLTDIHQKFPFFDIDKKIESLTDVQRWKGIKLIKQMDREFGWAFNVPSGLTYQRNPTDSIPKVVSLTGFHPSQEESERIKKMWPDFIEECRRRKEEFERLNINPLQQYFYETPTEVPPNIEDAA